MANYRENKILAEDATGILAEDGSFILAEQVHWLGIPGLVIVDCQHAGYTLTKDIIMSYSKIVGDGLTASEILTALLAYQEVERVTFGGVSPSLNVVMPIEVSKKTIWEACKQVRDTVGGFIHIIINPANPMERKLWLTDTLGRETGQQIRLGKNLSGLRYETDYISYANRLYVIGGSDTLLTSKTYSQIGVDQDEDTFYGYLTLQQHYGAYKDWTGIGDNLPANITVWKPSGSWINPTGHETSTGWSNPENAYDNNELTFAQTYPWYPEQWTGYLVLTYATGKTTTQLSVPNQWTRKYTAGPWLPALIQVDVYSGGEWQNVYYGQNWLVWPSGTNFTVSFSSRNITKVRYRACNMGESGLPFACNVFEIYIWNPTGLANDNSNWKQGVNEKTVRCAIGNYDSSLSYLISYTHAPYLIALDEISERADIVSAKLELQETDVDILLERGRTHLDELLEPVISIDTALVDMATEESKEDEELELGSVVTVIDEGLDVEHEARIVRIHKPNLLQPEKVDIEISTKVKDIIDVI